MGLQIIDYNRYIYPIIIQIKATAKLQGYADKWSDALAKLQTISYFLKEIGSNTTTTVNENTIYLSGNFLQLTLSNQVTTLLHEYVHTKQYNLYGAWGFYWRYFVFPGERADMEIQAVNNEIRWNTMVNAELYLSSAWVAQKAQNLKSTDYLWGVSLDYIEGQLTQLIAAAKTEFNVK